MVSNIIIIGSGPAAYTAAIYLARSMLEPLLFEGDGSNGVQGGLLTTTKEVENFPGFPNGVDGFELTDNLKAQALRFGTKIISEQVIKIARDDTFKVISNENIYETKAVIIATGSTPKKLNIPGFDSFWNKGISTCATCDGNLPCFRNVPIAVVGGGDTACEEALHLTHTASKVYLIHRRDSLRASKIMADRVLKHTKIEMIWNSEVIEVKGTNHVEKITISSKGDNKELNVSGLFVAIGHTPNSQFVSDFVDCDEYGYIKTDRKLSTNMKGIWAAGDVQDPYYRQAITAAGSGCMAALEAERWLQLTN